MTPSVKCAELNLHMTCDRTFHFTVHETYKHIVVVECCIYRISECHFEVALDRSDDDETRHDAETETGHRA